MGQYLFLEIYLSDVYLIIYKLLALHSVFILGAMCFICGVAGGVWEGVKGDQFTIYLPWKAPVVFSVLF